MVKEEVQLLTEDFMYGEWYGKDASDPNNVLEYNLNVGKETSQFMVVKNGVKSNPNEFSSVTSWMDRFLYFDTSGKYFIEKANETDIVFGELATPTDFNGKYKIREVLKRVD